MNVARLLTVVWLASSCTLNPSAKHEDPRYFDLGPAISPSDACSADIELGTVRASTALQGSRMWYRLDNNPYEPVPFAISRWVAPPAVLVQHHIGGAFSTQTASVRLDLTMQRMELHLSADGRGQSHIAIQATASSPATPARQRNFTLKHAAHASPAGAAEAMAISIANWIEDLCAWLDKPEVDTQPE